MTLNDITSDTATLRDYVAQRELELAERIFADLEEFHAVGNYQEFYVLTEESVDKLKKKYGIVKKHQLSEFQKLAAWEHCTYTPGGIHDQYGCTNCGFKTGWTTDFCGGCGAYMRGDFNG